MPTLCRYPAWIHCSPACPPQHPTGHLGIDTGTVLAAIEVAVCRSARRTSRRRADQANQLRPDHGPRPIGGIGESHLAHAPHTTASLDPRSILKAPVLPTPLRSVAAHPPRTSDVRLVPHPAPSAPHPAAHHPHPSVPRARSGPRLLARRRMARLSSASASASIPGCPAARSRRRACPAPPGPPGHAPAALLLAQPTQKASSVRAFASVCVWGQFSRRAASARSARALARAFVHF